jgi:Protein of unknown function (DUF2452)
MIGLYNFLGSWQLFPEKGNYEHGERPKSGIYNLEAAAENKVLTITHNWTSIENNGYASRYAIIADGAIHECPRQDLADSVQLALIDSIQFNISFYKENQAILLVKHEILPNGYLKVHQEGRDPEGKLYTNTEIYHRQMSVLPYAASVAGALVKPTEEGIIRHKALKAMEEQTNMQLEQIRRQIELLALQAQEIHKRKELSMVIYNSRLSFKPEIGQVYYLYEKHDGSHIISLISPKEWGATLPFKNFIAAVQLLADHTWIEVETGIH